MSTYTEMKTSYNVDVFSAIYSQILTLILTQSLWLCLFVRLLFEYIKNAPSYMTLLLRVTQLLRSYLKVWMNISVTCTSVTADI